MKDAIALQSLTKIAANYERNAKELTNAKRRVRELTKQRDEANARNAELRQHIARYQADLAQARAAARNSRPSAWAGISLRQLEAA